MKKKTKPKKKFKTTKKLLSPPHPQNTYTARATAKFVATVPLKVKQVSQ